MSGEIANIKFDNSYFLNQEMNTQMIFVLYGFVKQFRIQ